MILDQETYSVELDEATNVVRLKGIMRQNGLAEYAPVTELLTEAATRGDTLTLDLTELDFLNSSGIAMLSKFVIAMRGKPVGLAVRGSNTIPWQGKSLPNLKKLMPPLDLQFDG
ncbi:MAG: slr1659 superfamily regulator [Magnetovibrionaceae bacterium]